MNGTDMRLRGGDAAHADQRIGIFSWASRHWQPAAWTLVLAAVLQAIVLAPVAAQPTRTWNGSQSTDWQNPHNWSPSGGPEGIVVIPVAPGPVINGRHIQIKGPLSITGDTSLTIENGATYRHHGPVDIYIGSVIGSAQLCLIASSGIRRQ